MDLGLQDSGERSGGQSCRLGKRAQPAGPQEGDKGRSVGGSPGRGAISRGDKEGVRPLTLRNESGFVS